MTATNTAIDILETEAYGKVDAEKTAALYLARAKYRVLVLEKEQFGGQISISHEVVNYPGIAKIRIKRWTDRCITGIIDIYQY